MKEKHNLTPKEAKFLEELTFNTSRYESIPRVDEVKWNTFGVKIVDNNIVGLGLYRCTLINLPESIWNLESLQYLNLRGNRLKTLPEPILELKSLQTLDLSSNKLTTLPESFSKLKSLETLYLGHNNLKFLPKSFGNLDSLKELHLRGNQLTTLPKPILELKSLQFLNLTGNKSITLPEYFGNLKSLKSLYLGQCNLKTLPESITKLESLEYLSLKLNQLTTLPESFGRLINLRQVSLTENKWKGEWKELNKNHLPTILKLCRKLYGINIFISHVMKDKEVYPIMDLKNNLEKRDIIHEVIICEDDLFGNIKEFMDQEVLGSDLLLFIATKTSKDRPAVQHEIALAKKYGIMILPIKGRDITWDDLKQIDLIEEKQELLDLSKMNWFEFDDKNVKKLSDELYEYFKKQKTELRKFRKIKEMGEKKELNILKLQIKKKINEFIHSSEFRKNVGENLEKLQKIFQDLSDGQLTLFEFFSKWENII